jgi:CMP-N,N'-diacetyllegionaminic acid synthase
MRTLGLVPARGGSKGLPRKNVLPLAGKPLLAWTIEAASGSRLDAVVVTTDDAEIAALARSLGADVVDRPAALASDEAGMLEVVLHALAERPGFEAVAVLQPTSPLRRAEHIDATLDALAEPGSDAAVTVVAVPHRYVPEQLMALEADGQLVAVDLAAPLRRQDKPALYARNGPAVLALRADGLAERGFYGGVVRAVTMSELDSLDVDSAADLELAELALGRVT